MIYLIGGAPRAGKSILCQQVATKLKVGWISTDLLLDLLRVKQEEGVKTEWNAAPEAIAANADWFLPYLERFIWGVGSLAESYVIEGVDFLPVQVRQLSSRYQIQAVFLGCSQMTWGTFHQFPGRSPQYLSLREDLRRRIVQDIPIWSQLIQQEAARFGYTYIDMGNEFPRRLTEAESALMAGE